MTIWYVRWGNQCSNKFVYLFVTSQVRWICCGITTLITKVLSLGRTWWLTVHLVPVVYSWKRRFKRTITEHFLYVKNCNKRKNYLVLIVPWNGECIGFFALYILANIFIPVSWFIFVVSFRVVTEKGSERDTELGEAPSSSSAFMPSPPCTKNKMFVC